MSVLDGECQVERDLAELRAFAEEFTSADDDLLDDLAMLKLNGPKDPTEIATKAASGAG